MRKERENGKILINMAHIDSKKLILKKRLTQVISRDFSTIYHHRTAMSIICYFSIQYLTIVEMFALKLQDGEREWQSLDRHCLHQLPNTDSGETTYSSSFQRLPF
jgi:hypothetical protein